MKDTEHAIPKKRRLGLPVTLSVFLISVNIVLMVFWILLLASTGSFSGLTIGTIGFAFILVGLVIYLVMTIKEVKLNQRQANFISSVTHELKTPIAALKLSIDTLKIRQIPEDQQAAFFSKMERQLERLDALISQLLEVQRLEDIAHQPTTVVKWKHFLETCAAAACVKQSVDPSVVTLNVDSSVNEASICETATEMIVINLIDNAIKYSGNKPRVVVEAVATRSNRIRISIIDNGPGILHDERTDIFKRFYRSGNELERKTTGTGLGLYICQTLVKSLKGNITVGERADGTGSVFQVELPLDTRSG